MSAPPLEGSPSSGSGSGGTGARGTMVQMSSPAQKPLQLHFGGSAGSGSGGGRSGSGPASGQFGSTAGFGGDDDRKQAENHDSINLHERDILPELIQTPLDDVLVRSTISRLPPSEQGNAIVRAFNDGIKGDRAITTTLMPCRSGERIDRGQFYIAHRNFVPEIAPYSPQKLTTCFSFYLPNTVIEKMDVVERMSPFYGGHGTWVVNVPQGKYARIWSGQIPKLLDQGTHVIHDATFRLGGEGSVRDPAGAFVDISIPQLQHGTIHILRVPVGKIAKVWVNSATPNLLYSRGDGVPYVVNDPQFKVDGFVSQTDMYVCHGTIHIIRVDAGQYAKIWIGNVAHLLSSRPEPYTFHSPIFRFSPADVCSQLDPYIQHGTTHILRIPSGMLCKAWKGAEPLILESRVEPYQFDDPLFRVENPKNPFSSQMDPYIRHMNIHRLRIPAGKIAKVWQGNTPIILHSQEAHYEFNSPYFRLTPNDPKAIAKDGTITNVANLLYEDAFSSYIQHGTIHIIRVPSGKIARVWEGAKAMLLEYRQEPYSYDSPLFRLERRRPTGSAGAQVALSSMADGDDDEYKSSSSSSVQSSGSGSDSIFEEATSPCIIHGSLKRLQPRTGEVCLCYDNGQLVVREPPTNGRPILIDDETLVFPSEETKRNRKRENASIDINEINYEVFTTKDSLRVGVKLLVAYKIVDPRKAIIALTKEGIVKHVENCCVVDMGKSIQACSSKDFLSSAQNKPVRANAASSSDISPGEPSLLQHFQDTVKMALASDLHEYGIELVRLNFETPKVLDKEIAKQMAELSLNVASVSSQEAVMNQKAHIARVQAEQQATVQRIEQEQINANKLSIARTKKESAQLEADALVIAADAARQAAAMQGAQYGSHPSLLQIRLAEIQATAMQQAKISIMVAPSEVSHAMAGLANLQGVMQMAQMQAKA